METNPVTQWRTLMAQACKTGKLDRQALTQAETKAVEAGHRRTDMAEPKECKPFFDQAGAQSLCPRLLAVRRGFFPVYDYDNCQFTKFFEPQKEK